ncbi:MAG: peptidoglycan DD-metalloendopeptidase family protein [Magnetospirillum sp. WYHS-4]
MTDGYEWQSRLDRVRAKIREYFPERQFVLRTEGRVSFVRLSPRIQMMGLAVVVALGGWATFATVNYAIFDRILESKEKQIANTRLAYRGLLDEVSTYQKKFGAISADLEANHGVILGLVEQNASLQQSLRSVETQLVATERDREHILSAREGLKNSLSSLKDRLHHLNNNNFALKENLTTIEESLQGVVAERDRALREGRELKKHRDALESRLSEIQETEKGAVQKLMDHTMTYIDSMEKVVELAGLDVNRLLDGDADSTRNMGGPFVEVKPEPDTLPGAQLKNSLDTLDARLERTAALQGLMKRLPLAAPMDSFNLSSGFGKRRDPVNKRWAMHYGLDLTGAQKSPIYATAPGKVIFAGWKDKYGRLVEIDHGAGIISRYGHLERIFVKQGQDIDFHEKVGLLGNTGRTTGMHLHYEVSFNGKPKNPLNFIKAGRHVFKE